MEAGPDRVRAGAQITTGSQASRDVWLTQVAPAVDPPRPGLARAGRSQSETAPTPKSRPISRSSQKRPESTTRA